MQETLQLLLISIPLRSPHAFAQFQVRAVVYVGNSFGPFLASVSMFHAPITDTVNFILDPLVYLVHILNYDSCIVGSNAIRVCISSE